MGHLSKRLEFTNGYIDLMNGIKKPSQLRRFYQNVLNTAFLSVKQLISLKRIYPGILSQHFYSP